MNFFLPHLQIIYNNKIKNYLKNSILFQIKVKKKLNIIYDLDIIQCIYKEENIL